MYYIKVNTNSDDCPHCDFALSKTFYKNKCLNNKCPIKEMRPKKLEWQANVQGHKEASIGFAIFLIRHERSFLIFTHADGGKSEVLLCDNYLDRPEDFCQEYYDKIFNEMIGE